VSEERRDDFAELLETNLSTSMARAYKEQRVEFWYQPDTEAENIVIQPWYRSIMRSRLPKVKKVVKILNAHLSGLADLL